MKPANLRADYVHVLCPHCHTAQPSNIGGLMWDMYQVVDASELTCKNKRCGEVFTVAGVTTAEVRKS